MGEDCMCIVCDMDLQIHVLQTSHVCGCTNHIQDTYKASPALFYVSSDAMNRAKVYQGQLCTEDVSCITFAYLQYCYSEKC